MSELEKLIHSVYKNRVFIGDGKPNAKIQYNLPKSFSGKEDYVIYLNHRDEVAVIWNYKNRRGNNFKPSSLCVSKEWSEINLSEEGIEDVYKKYIVGNERLPEKVLLVSFRFLPQIIDELDVYMEYNADDKNFDSSLFCEQIIATREYISTKKLSRDSKFREKILRRYNCQCAICRCSEERILEAAHIVAVKNHGSDDTENGICLCANHHKMYDNDLIRIDFEKGTLSYVSDSVKRMSWYEDYIKKYKSKIICIEEK